jgi:hypothetical protein
MTKTRRLLRDVAPTFVSELAEALKRDGHELLADQVAALELWDRCGCQVKSCCSFYAGPKPSEPWRNFGDHFNLVLSVRKGMVVLDVVDGVIRYVEILDRPDVGKLLSPWNPKTSIGHQDLFRSESFSLWVLWTNWNDENFEDPFEHHPYLDPYCWAKPDEIAGPAGRKNARNSAVRY